MVQESPQRSQLTEFGSVASPALSRPKPVRELLPTPLLAQRHRAWTLGLPPQCEAPAQSAPLIIAVGGGKGGVGKSLIASNLAAKLARTGFRVAALDLDCGGSNLHTYFGMNSPEHCLGEFIVQGKCELRDVLVQTPIDGLMVAASQRDDAWSVADALAGVGLTRLWAGILSLGARRDLDGFDIVLLDLGAGTARHTIDLFACAHMGLITALPEPTSVENAYLFLRTTLFRLFEHAGGRLSAPDQVQEIIRALNFDAPGQAQRSYTDKLRMLYQGNPGIVGPLASVLSGRVAGIVVNQIRSQADIDIGKAMEMAAQRYFGFTSAFLGYLNYDEAAWKSLRNRRLLLMDFPQSVLTRRLSEVSNALLRGVGVNVGS